MIGRRELLASLSLLGAGLVPLHAKAKAYQGPPVDRLVVYKSHRKMFLLNKKTAVKSYDIALGFAPEGSKEKLGDGRTPEGDYRINRRNENSRFHLSLGISYPDRNDRKRARQAGIDPGGDIFIHGRCKFFRRVKGDWTWGCIAVRDKEMEEIFDLVELGTVISIYP